MEKEKKHSLKSRYRWLRIRQLNGHHAVKTAVEDMPQCTCLNCGTTYNGKFCPCCGQPASTRRFTLKDTFRHVVFFFSKFDDKFWHTIVNLCYRPGHMIREYIEGRRADYFRPIQMLVCMLTIYALVTYVMFPGIQESHFLNIEDGNEEAKMQMLNSIGDGSVLQMLASFAEKAMNNHIVMSLAQTVFYTFPCWLVFRTTEIGKRFNMAEHFMSLVYIACLSTLLSYIMLIPYFFAGKLESPTFFGVIIMTIVYKQLFRISIHKSLLLTLAASVLMGLLAALFAVIIVLVLVLLGIIHN